MNNHRDEWDDLIDAALPEYSAAEPLAGLEHRVLQRIQAREVGRRPAWRRWWPFAVPALAAILLAGILVRTPRQAVPPAASTRLHNAAPRPGAVEPPSPPSGVTALTARRRVARRRALPVTQLPKKDVFPSPAPVTQEERMLVAWAERAPSEALRVVTDLRKRTDEPVSIQEIQIEPLPRDGSQ